GGDYHDVFPIHGHPSGTWIAIGDVSGHGLGAGVVMMMLETALLTITREHGVAHPSDVIGRLNEVLFENVRGRLRSQEHVTFTLLRHDGSGRFEFAGAHEDILVVRAREGRSEWIATHGTWLGLAAEVS